MDNVREQAGDTPRGGVTARPGPTGAAAPVGGRVLTLLHLCALPRARDTLLPRLRDAAAALDDWPSFITQARRHRLLPLAAHHFERAGPPLPPAARDALVEASIANTVRSRRIGELQARVVERLAAAGLDALPVKGLALAALAYDVPELRQCDDIDLLVPRDRLREACAQVAAMGEFIPLPQGHPSRGCTLRHREETVWLDLMPRWAPPEFDVPGPLSVLAGRRTQVHVGGRPMETLAPDLCLLHLAVHGAKHRWDRLYLAADLLGILPQLTAADWDRLGALAAATGSLRRLRLALALARHVDPDTGPIPADRLEPETETSRLLAEVVATHRSADAPSGRLRELAPFHLLSLERRRDRLRYLFFLAFTPTAADSECFPRLAGHPWRLAAARPFRLAGRLVAGLRHQP